MLNKSKMVMHRLKGECDYNKTARLFVRSCSICGVEQEITFPIFANADNEMWLIMPDKIATFEKIEGACIELWTIKGIHPDQLWLRPGPARRLLDELQDNTKFMRADSNLLSVVNTSVGQLKVHLIKQEQEKEWTELNLLTKGTFHA